MLLELILTPLFVTVDWVLGLFPVIAMPTGMESGLGNAFGLVRGLSVFIPVDTFFIVLSIYFSVYALEFLISFSSWLFRKVPTLS